MKAGSRRKASGLRAAGISPRGLFAALFLAFPLMSAGATLAAHDPSAIKEGEYTYVFSTGQGIPVSRTRDFIKWEYVGPVFGKAPEWAWRDVPGFGGDLWAPDISYFNGSYHLYYAVSSFGQNRSCIGLAVNPTLDPKSPDYRWTDLGKVIESFPGKDFWNAIDPNLAVDETGRYWLAFGSFWGGIKMTEMDPQSGRPLKNPPELLSLAARPGVENDPIEAPYIIRREGFFYLFVSFDYCCRRTRSDYKIAVGRSPRITGPYVDREGGQMMSGGGTVILETAGDDHGPGHNAVLQDGGTYWLIHHVYDARRGGTAVLRVRRITWTEDGWPLPGEPLDPN